MIADTLKKKYGKGNKMRDVEWFFRAGCKIVESVKLGLFEQDKALQELSLKVSEGTYEFGYIDRLEFTTTVIGVINITKNSTTIQDEPKEERKISSQVIFIGKDEWYCGWYMCNKCECETIMDDFNYCPSCGRKISWK